MCCVLYYKVHLLEKYIDCRNMHGITKFTFISVYYCPHVSASVKSHHQTTKQKTKKDNLNTFQWNDTFSDT
jgi:hypothetical protein